MSLFGGSPSGTKRRRVVGAVGAAALTVGTVVGIASPAQSASFTGLTGGYTAGGVTYAKAGTSLTSTVANSQSAKCVYWEDRSTSPSTFLGSTWQNSGSPSSWSLTFAAPAGNGVRNLWAMPTKSFTSGTNAGTSTTVNRCVTIDTHNSETAATGSYTLDNTVPTITGSVAPAAGKPAAQNGWYRDDAVVSFSCSDAGSGIKSCTPAETLTGQGANISRTGTAEDNLGHTSTSTVSGINIDRSAPLTTADAPSGWRTAGVTVTLSASDNLSGVASTHYSLNNGAWTAYTSGIALGEGRHTLKYRSTDVAGNVEAEKTALVDIDVTAPRIDSSQDPAKNGAGWNNQNSVEVSFTCSDALSGVASCTTPQSVTAEGLTNVQGNAADVAGNINQIVHPVSIDRTVPTIGGAIAGTAGNSGWYTSDVTVNFTCDDDLSGVVSCPDSASFGEGAGQSVTRSVSDLADNSASATVNGINVDKQAPTTSSNAPAGWQARDFTLKFTAYDQAGLSGVAYTEYSRDGGQTWTQGDSIVLAEGNHTVLYRSVDVAGNVEQHKTATVDVDTTNPVVSIAGPASTENATATVTGTGTDLGSGVASVTVNGTAVTLTDGAYSTEVALNEGSNTVTAEATDRAGRTHTVSTTITRTVPVIQPPAPPAAPVTVEWTHKGFYNPIGEANSIIAKKGAEVPTASTSTVWNTAKGGSTIPLKFNVAINGEQQSSTGSDVITSFNATRITCPSSTPITDAVEELANAGSSSLRYADGQYIQNWKTASVSSNTCFRVALTTADGSAIYTFVQLRK